LLCIKITLKKLLELVLKITSSNKVRQKKKGKKGKKEKKKKDKKEKQLRVLVDKWSCKKKKKTKNYTQNLL